MSSYLNSFRTKCARGETLVGKYESSTGSSTVMYNTATITVLATSDIEVSIYQTSTDNTAPMPDRNPVGQPMAVIGFKANAESTIEIPLIRRLFLITVKNIGDNDTEVDVETRYHSVPLGDMVANIRASCTYASWTREEPTQVEQKAKPKGWFF